MRISPMRLWVILRRFKRAAHDNGSLHHSQHTVQVEALVRRADPLAPWNERTNWIVDLAGWLRKEARHSRFTEYESRHHRAPRNPRTLFFLNWLDSHPEAYRMVQATLQNTLHEALGPDIFCATGLPREPAFFNEFMGQIVNAVLPEPPAQTDLSALFTAMFPDPEDADWLIGLDPKTLARLWRLASDDGIAQNYREQIDEALEHLVMMIVTVGVGPAFRKRLQPAMALRDTPFMALRSALESYLAEAPDDRTSLSRVRRMIAVCRAQTDRIYAHLDKHGVSVGLVYYVEGMRAQLARMARLIDLRASAGLGQGVAHAQDLLATLIRAHHERASMRGLMRRNFSLLARKMVERNADHGEHYIARDRAEYLAMLRAACIGGVITAFALLGKNWVTSLGLAKFFEGLFVSIDFAVGFLLILSLGGVLATKQPAVTAPALAARMVELDTVTGLRSLLHEIACLLRSQAAAVFGNLVAVIPTMLLLCALLIWINGVPPVSVAKAQAGLAELSVFGVTPLFAAFTGVLLWLASLVAGFADNWFALRRMREAIAHQRRLILTLGAPRAQRFAAWVEDHLAAVVGNVTLAQLLGMTPVVAGFFGLPLNTRHVTLSTASLTADMVTLGWSALGGGPFWLAVAGILVIGLLNVGVAFGCALALAMRAREVPTRVRRIVFRQVWKRFSASPASFFFSVPPEPGPDVADEEASAKLENERRHKGR